MTALPDILDDALDRLAGHAFVDGPGFACHGTMGAQALTSLGAGERVPAWVDAYVAAHPPVDAPPPRSTIHGADRTGWQEALGDFSRARDWLELFERELADEPWRAVVRRWAPRLVPGCAGGLTHGLLRTAHAVRAMQDVPVPSNLMRRELAFGLASWAAWFRELPGDVGFRGRLAVSEVVAALAEGDQAWTPVEAATFARIDEVPDFSASVSALGRPPGDLSDALSDLTAIASSLLIANPESPPPGLVHALTPVSAVRTLLPFLEASIDQVIPALVKVTAGLAVGFAHRRPSPADTGAQPGAPPDAALLSARAAAHADPHVIKLTDACLREHAIRPDPVYLHAAWSYVERSAA